VYESALERASAGEEPVIRWALAQLLLGVRRPALALAQADAALATSPGNPELLLTRARALEALGRPEALDTYRAALAAAEGRVGPVFAADSPRLQAAVAERLAGRARLSVTRYRRAYAHRLTDEQRWSQALAEWERAQAEAPLSAREQFSRGLALEATGDRVRAIEALRQAAALEGSLPAFRARLAARLWDNEQYVEAVAEWQRIAAYEPGNVEARVALARAYLKMGDHGRALDEYRRVLALAPNHAEARQSVARLSAVPRSAVPRSAVPRSAVPRSAVPRSAVPRSAVPRSAVHRSTVQ
jgi:tetratricopeptide (TPR) repeat protein